MEENEYKGKKNRKYNEARLKSAIESVLESRMTVYRASKEFNVPWSTLKANVVRIKKDREDGVIDIRMKKMGRPFSLPVDIEQKLLAYIIEMQEKGLGLTVTRIKEIAFSLAQASGCKHYFNVRKQCAGWNWWVSFKDRYGLSLRTPENLSAGRAICSNPTVIADFYEKLRTTLDNHNLIDIPERLWNCDETGLMYVNKPTKIVTKIGKKYVYNRTYAEKGTTTTVLACINAAGNFLPPLVIFKGVRNIPELANGAMPNSLTRLSPKGWINAGLFLEWLHFFNENIPPARPVLLIMDSHASHVCPEVLDFARSHEIILFTMPAHTSHILQPLDVGVFRPLKAAWRAELQDYRLKHPNKVPTRYDFHKFLTPVYEKSFTPSNIRGGFRKAGIYPLNKDAVCPEATGPSTLSDQPIDTEQLLMETIENDDELANFETSTTNDPLREVKTKETNTGESSIPSTSSILTSQTQDYDPSESLQMECEPQQIDKIITTTDVTPAPKSSKKIQIHDILVLPKWDPKQPKTHHKRTVPKAQCLTPVVATLPSSSSTLSISTPSLRHFRRSNSNQENQEPQPQQSSKQKNTAKSRKEGEKKENIKQTCQSVKVSKLSIFDDDWVCQSCNGSYSQDVKQKNGAEWITCSFCISAFHIHCQSQVIGDNQTVFMCDYCSIDNSSEEE